MSVEFIAEYERENKTAAVFSRDDIYEVDFYEDRQLIGTVSYPDKSIYYVEDAAYNYVTGVMTKETVEKYKKVSQTT
jgi:hypothetical protein